jgi:hypothetical protein
MTEAASCAFMAPTAKCATSAPSRRATTLGTGRADMATYVINEKYNDTREVVAHKYAVEGDFVHFSDGSGHRVLSLRTASIYTIEDKKN